MSVTVTPTASFNAIQPYAHRPNPPKTTSKAASAAAQNGTPAKATGAVGQQHIVKATTAPTTPLAGRPVVTAPHIAQPAGSTELRTVAPAAVQTPIKTEPLYSSPRPLNALLGLAGLPFGEDDAEKQRLENRERKKRWREANEDRNKDNDLRCRVNKRANKLFGKGSTDSKENWIEEEFSKRKAKRHEKEGRSPDGSVSLDGIDVAQVYFGDLSSAIMATLIHYAQEPPPTELQLPIVAKPRPKPQSQPPAKSTKEVEVKVKQEADNDVVMTDAPPAPTVSKDAKDDASSGSKTVDVQMKDADAIDGGNDATERPQPPPLDLAQALALADALVSLAGITQHDARLNAEEMEYYRIELETCKAAAAMRGELHHKMGLLDPAMQDEYGSDNDFDNDQASLDGGDD